jgi:hypothetical protein
VERREVAVRGAFSASQFAGLSATLVWTLGWVAVAWVAVDRLAESPEGPAFLGLGVATLMTALGCLVTVPFLRSGRFVPGDVRAPPEPWSRRITGWLAGLFVCGIAVVWNIGIFAGLLDAAVEGNGWWMVCLIPMSLGGWFLLLVLFVGVGVMIDSLLTVLRRRRV